MIVQMRLKLGKFPRNCIWSACSVFVPLGMVHFQVSVLFIAGKRFLHFDVFVMENR